MMTCCDLCGQFTHCCGNPCRHFEGTHAPFLLLYISAAVHLPFSICCSLFMGVSEEARNLWRGLDIFFIFTCGGDKHRTLSHKLQHQLQHAMQLAVGHTM